MHKQLYSGQKQLLVYCGDTFTIEVENNHNYKAIFLKKGERWSSKYRKRMFVR